MLSLLRVVSHIRGGYWEQAMAEMRFQPLDGPLLGPDLV